jgi:hypothetical protein
MGALFKAILIIALVYYLFKIILRVFVPYWLNQVFKEFVSPNNSNNHHFKQNRKEKKVTINNSGRKSDKIDQNIGEYVDYEEIKD